MNNTMIVQDKEGKTIIEEMRRKEIQGRANF